MYGSIIFPDAGAMRCVWNTGGLEVHQPPPSHSPTSQPAASREPPRPRKRCVGGVSVAECYRAMLRCFIGPLWLCWSYTTWAASRGCFCQHSSKKRPKNGCASKLASVHHQRTQDPEVRAVNCSRAATSAISRPSQTSLGLHNSPPGLGPAPTGALRQSGPAAWPAPAPPAAAATARPRRRPCRPPQ
jgi:hypothetical protein